MEYCMLSISSETKTPTQLQGFYLHSGGYFLSQLLPEGMVVAWNNLYRRETPGPITNSGFSPRRPDAVWAKEQRTVWFEDRSMTDLAGQITIGSEVTIASGFRLRSHPHCLQGHSPRSCNVASIRHNFLSRVPNSTAANKLTGTHRSVKGRQIWPW